MSSQTTHTKTCSKCGTTGGRAAFVPDKFICKACNNARRRAAYRSMPEAERQRLLETNKAWRAANREATRAQKREYCRRNRVRVAAQQKAWREANADSLQASKRAYFLANIEAIRAKNRARKAANRPQANAVNSRRRARLRNAPGWEYTTAQHIAWRWQMWGGRCWVCGAEAEATDHVIPINDDGPHWPANLRPICKSCNSSRKKKCRKRK